MRLPPLINTSLEQKERNEKHSQYNPKKTVTIQYHIVLYCSIFSTEGELSFKKLYNSPSVHTATLFLRVAVCRIPCLLSASEKLMENKIYPEI
jgi:hypothetical protein